MIFSCKNGLYKDGFWCTDKMHLLGAPSTVKYTPSKYTKLRVNTLAYRKKSTRAAI